MEAASEDDDGFVLHFIDQHPDGIFAQLIIGKPVIDPRKDWASEDILGQIEIDTMRSDVRSAFILVPLEFQCSYTLSLQQALSHHVSLRHLRQGLTE